MAEWSIAVLLKSIEGNTSRGSNPFLSAIIKKESKSPRFLIIALTICGSSSVGRARLFQSRGREFEPRLPLYGEKRITVAGRHTRILEPNCLRTRATDHRIMRRSAVRPPTYIGALVQLVRMLPCHGRGHGFESRTYRHNDINYNERKTTLYCSSI